MKLPNPLDKFTSHSIHYIMLAAKTTESLNAFNENVTSNGSPGLDAIDKATFLGEEVSFGGATAFLVLDTRRFSQFTIAGLKTKVKPTGMTANYDLSPNSITSEFSFTVVDPMGILFSNFLQYIMEQKLGVSFNGMACLFRILFVGHLPDGTTETVTSVAVPCLFAKIKLEMSEMKGMYECTMTPLIGANGSTSIQKWTNIGVASKFFTGKNKNTLVSVIESFEKGLNDQSKKMYDNLNKNNDAGGKLGRKVEYMITIPEKWEQYQMTGPNQGRIEETSFVELLKKQESKKPENTDEKPKPAAKESNIAVEAGVSIMQALDVIFSQCVELAQLANFKKSKSDEEKITFYKHIVNITSDEETYMVHVDIIEFTAPNVKKAEASGGIADWFYTSTKDGVQRHVPKNAVEYEYAYSGTNIDVLELVLQFQDLNFMLQSPTKIGSAQVNTKSSSQGQKQEAEKGTEDTSDKLSNNIKKYDPILLSDRTWADDRNFSNLANNVKVGKADPREIHQQYIRNLAAMYSTGQSPEASTVLRGNPYLMLSTSITQLPKHVKFSPGAKKAYRQDFEQKITKVNGLDSMERGTINSGQFTGGNFAQTPLFVKINIYGPKFDVANKGLVTHEVDPAVDYSQLYFDENYYFCDTIESEISDGAIFKHTLLLRPYSIFSSDLGVPSEKKQ
jgi:hypothetical protein